MLSESSQHCHAISLNFTVLVHRLLTSIHAQFLLPLIFGPANYKT